MDHLVIDTLRPLNLALGVLLLWTAWSDRARYSGPYAAWPVWSDLIVSAFMLYTASWAYYKAPPDRLANPWGFATVLLLSLTAGTALAVQGAAELVPSLAFVALGTGIVFFSMRWLVAALATVALTWIFVISQFDLANTGQPSFLMQVAIILAFVVGWARRRAYGQILEARDRAEVAHVRATRLNEELEHFAQVVTHDLQTPLTALRLKARIARIALERDDGPMAEAALQDIDRIANESGVFVLEMLDYARSGEHALRKENISMDAVMAEVADLVEAPLMAVGGRLKLGALPTVHGDFIQMRQLMLNLVSNSIRYRREGTPLVVEVRGQADPGGVALMVEDNGLGFTPEEAARLFLPFEMGSKGKGHGLGLALCKRIADAHGGNISAEGRPGEGATFTVEIPLAVTLQHDAGVSHPT